MRKLRRLWVLLLAVPVLMLLPISSASAVDNNWGTTTNGFTLYPVTTQDHCVGDSVYEFEAYRSGATQVTVMWQVHAHGVMHIRGWDLQGPATGLRNYDSLPTSGDTVYWAHWSPTSVKLTWHFTFNPNSGGSCYDTYTVA